MAGNLDQIGQFGITFQVPPAPRGIPNFNTLTVFGKTSDIKQASTILCLFALASTILRLFSRRRFGTNLWWDDGCAGVAVVLLLANQILFLRLEYLGKTSFAFTALMDPEMERRRLERVVSGLKISLAVEVLYLLAVYAVKFGMLFLYARFAKQTRIITLYLRVTQFLVLLAFITCLFALLLGCRPLSLYWSISSTLCTRRLALTYASGTSNILTNTLILAVPVPLLLRATLTRKQKAGVGILYFMGVLVVTASALRFVTQVLGVSVPQAVGWSQIEIALAIVLSCVPMVAKLLLTPWETPAKAEGGKLRRGVAQVDRERRETFGTAEGPRVMTEVEKVKAFGTTTTVTAGSEVEFAGGQVDFQKLKVVRAEVNGECVWEVRPVSPGTPGGGMGGKYGGV